ncbi:MAG TPA: DUF3313 family protein [Candidatus Binataceae bacterium]|nr:DUF3313 family protein [Candidatus Binataceae bacterium]
MRPGIRITALLTSIRIAAGAAALTLAMAGCSSGAAPGMHLGALGGKPAPPPAVALALETGFLPDPARMSANSRYPFAESWVEPGADFHSYSKIMLAPVSLEHLQPPASGSDADANQDNKPAALDAAIFAGDALNSAIQQDSAHRFTAASSPDAKTVIVEMAIVELEPNRADIAASSLGMATYASVAAALESRSKHTGRGSVGMEMILRDGRTNQVIAIFADTRRADAPAGEAKITPGYGFADPIVGEWMRQTIAMLAS